MADWTADVADPGGRGAVHRVNTLTADDLWSTFLVDAAVGYNDHALLVQDELVSRMGCEKNSLL